MTATFQTFVPTFVLRRALPTLTCALLLAFGAAPVLAQDGGGTAKKEKIEQLKRSFKGGLQAAKAGQHSQAYTQLEQALQLAEEVELSSAATKVQGYLQKLPKNWGNTAIENKQFGDALTHFEKGIEHAPNDAYMHYGKGLALVNMDSTQAGLKTLQQAIEVGNQTGNTRVTGLAETRIRKEFLAKASKALNAQDPTTAQADTALSALDEMRNYVDPSANSLFYRGRALFEKGEYQQATEAAEEGLSMHQGSRSDAAKFHFIIAESQLRVGNKSSACQTFQQATYGDYKARAEHYLKNECEN
jgi:tetratricopeptide (TPR) repeat protein